MTSSVTKICKDLYKLDVIAALHNDTLGVLLYTDRLIDASGQFNKDFVSEALMNLSTGITRVALSTDRTIDYVVVVLRGMEDGNEIRVIRDLVDVKKAQTDALSVEETMNRTVQELGKYTFDPLKADEIPLNDVTTENFFTKQISQRVRLLSPPPKPTGPPMLPSEIVDGRFLDTPKRIFEFSILTFGASEPTANVLKILDQVNLVFKGYRYEDFDGIVIKDLLGRKILTVGRDDYLKFQKKQLTADDILRLGLKDDLSSTDHLKNALDIFEYNLH